MNQLQDLEEQQNALLERIRAKRAEYRRQLLPHERLLQEEQGIYDDNVFPRSITFRILTHHYYIVLIAAAALLFAGPRKTITAAVASSALAALQRYSMQHLFRFGK